MMIIFIAVSIKGYRDVKLGRDRANTSMFMRYDLDIDDEEYKEEEAGKGGIQRKETFGSEKKKDVGIILKDGQCIHGPLDKCTLQLLHIYDISTDIGVILEWYLLAYQQFNLKEDWALYDVYAHLNMTVLFIAALVALNLYRFISSFLLYIYTKKWCRFFSQFFDLEIFRIIYINHRLHRVEPGNLHRFLSKIEAIFESSPQSVLQVNP